ncbi:hypothetical protein E2C01_011416 [Portunus trituberculatus]|uniref:Uncharacterized protein n=1 Tax=Portunus trituberculatus TaxID=210409 RepID=A0A5B7DBC3_PORTR|nr:hypothetical protein [Portunus trituberculatus]
MYDLGWTPGRGQSAIRAVAGNVGQRPSSASTTGAGTSMVCRGFLVYDVIYTRLGDTGTSCTHPPKTAICRPRPCGPLCDPRSPCREMNLAPVMVP